MKPKKKTKKEKEIDRLIADVAQELKEDREDELREEIKVILSQIEHCKATLKELEEQLRNVAAEAV